MNLIVDMNSLAGFTDDVIFMQIETESKAVRNLIDKFIFDYMEYEFTTIEEMCEFISAIKTIVFDTVHIEHERVYLRCTLIKTNAYKLYFWIDFNDFYEYDLFYDKEDYYVNERSNNQCQEVE